MPALLIEQETPPLTTDASGTVRVGGTRVTLDVVIGSYKLGETAEQIAEDFDTLKLADVHAVLAYYLNHQAEVDAYLAERDRKAAEVRAKIEAQPGYWEHREAFKARAQAWKAQQAARPEPE